mmetsp:Transcript_12464/g.17799  ORF Transcript_12464/g.17799 Transcript_12464/m.17799 type:complete len:1447 (-) Transcript_12464:180-4520(-)
MDAMTLPPFPDTFPRLMKDGPHMANPSIWDSRICNCRLLDDDDDDDDDDNTKIKNKEEKREKIQSLDSHLKTVKELVKACADQVTRTATDLKAAEATHTDMINSQSDVIQITKRISRSKLWNTADYRQYLSTLTEHRHVMDVYGYLNLLKEGNSAIRSKTFNNNNNTGNNDDATQKDKDAKNDKNKRSRRFDWDYYRTCTSEGLRSVCYKFALSPNRVGIKLEDNLTLPNGFSWDKLMPQEDGTNTNTNTTKIEATPSDPKDWEPPLVEESDPRTFASDMVGSGELILLSTAHGETDDAHPELLDPLRGCRYVAAMELAFEPRIRRHLRAIYRLNAVLTTRPTKKGLDSIDYFHEFYGLHLLRQKPIKDHFPMDEREAELRKTGLSLEERQMLDEETKRRERDSCLQFMNLLKAERSNHLKIHIHLPYTDQGDDAHWYKQKDDFFNSREMQDHSCLMTELEKVYLPSNDDSTEWNDERRKILRLALTSILLPQFEAETRRDLREASTKIAIDAAGKNLQRMSMEGPYRPSHLLGENRFIQPTGDLKIVGVSVSSDSRDASYLAALSERGELTDHLAIPVGTQVDDPKMREKVITFLMHARPAAILVGTHGGLSSRLVSRKLGDLVTQATERWNNRGIQGQDEDDDEFQEKQKQFELMYNIHDDDEEEDFEWKCNVDLIDDNVSQLFGRSVRGKKEFPEASVNLKCAISIARHAKDPLAELCYAWSVASDMGTFGTEMLFLNIHPLQQVLPKSILLREYERALCHAVAQVGVDVNLACTFDHLHGLLSFVPGFGPRKAASLKQSLVRTGGVVASRKDLLAKRFLGPVVYSNAVAFIRIRSVGALENKSLHPLDDTRLHPDVYHRHNWAVKIAKDAFEIAETSESGADKENETYTALRDAMQDSKSQVKALFLATKEEYEHVHGRWDDVGKWDPKINVPSERWQDKVEDLDLETFAEMIETNNMGKWLSHLIMIKWEFRLPFEDPRKPMEPLDREVLFQLITGETDQTLCAGKEVTGKVARNTEFGSRIKLEGDVPGFIPLRNLADGHVESAEDIVKVGSVITAIITEVKKDHMCCDLSLKSEDFLRQPSEWGRPKSLPPLDQFFDKHSASLLEADMNKEREARMAALQLTLKKTRIDGNESMDVDQNEKRSSRVTRRACAHPAFRNARNDEVLKELKEGGESMVGEALIRPSSKVADCLAVNWMFRPGIIKVIEVSEEDKDNDASIGNTLKIKDEAYGSIDELLARYISPLNDRVEEAINHRKFSKLSEDHVDEKLKQMKKANPAGVFYYLCWNEKYPGYLSLRYIINTARHHAIGLAPDGFVWFRKTYPTLDKLLNAFKINPRGPSTPSMPPKSSKPQPPSRPSESRAPRWGARSIPAPPSVPPPPPTNTYVAPVTAVAASGWNQPPPALPPLPNYQPMPSHPPTNSWGPPPPPPPPPTYPPNLHH